MRFKGFLALGLMLAFVPVGATASESPDGTVSVSSEYYSPSSPCGEQVRASSTFTWPTQDLYYIQAYIYLEKPNYSTSIYGTQWYYYWGTPLPTQADVAIPSGLPDGTYKVHLALYASFLSGGSVSRDVYAATPLRVDGVSPSSIRVSPASSTVSQHLDVPYVGRVDVSVEREPSVGGSIVAQFDESLNPEFSSIHVTTVDGLRATGTTRYDADTHELIFDPSDPMIGRYHAIAVGMDRACNVGSVTWDFSVVAPPTAGP